MTDHEGAVAAFLAQARTADPVHYAAVCARHTIDEHPQGASLDEGRLDIVAVRYGVSEFRDSGVFRGPVYEGGSLLPPPTIAAMNQRRIRSRAKRRRPGPQRSLAVPWYPLDHPILLAAARPPA